MKKVTKDKTFNKIHAQIYKSSNLYSSLHKFKNNFSMDIITKYFNQVLSLAKFSNHTINNLHITDIKNINIGQFRDQFNDIWSQLIWTSLILNLYRTKLKTFNKIKSDFEREMLLGNLENADKILDEIEQEFGVSFWVIKNKMNILQEKNGLESQKEYSKSLQSKDINTRSKVLIYLYSVASEKNISFTYFNRIVNNFFDDQSNPNLVNYINYKLNKRYTIPPKDFSSVLEYESDSSFIDLYETFIDITENVLCSGLEYNENTLIFIKALRKIFKNTQDNRFVNILRYFNVVIPTTDDEKNKFVIQVFDDYNKEDYSNVINKCQELLDMNPSWTSLYEVYVQSTYLLNKDINFPKNSIIYKVMEAYLNMLEANEKTNDSIYFLLKTSVTYSNMSWVNEIISFVLNYIFDEDSYKNKMNILCPLIASSSKLILNMNKAQETYFNELKSIYPGSIVLNMRSLFDSPIESVVEYLESNNVSSDVKNDYISQYYLYNHSFSNSLEITEKLLNSNNIFIINEAISKHLLAQMKLDLEQACDKLVDLYLNNKNLSAILPLLYISNLIIKKINETGEWSNSINKPIIFYLCTIYRNSDLESRMEYSYEHYLVSHSYRRPMDMINEYKNKNKELNEKEIFFLKEICIPEIMKKSIYFINSNDVEKERVKICHELKIIDAKNEKEYLSEIRSREQSLYIKNEISRLEKNKIYVDIRGIKKLFKKELLDDYNRLEDLLKIGDFSIDDEIKDLLTKVEDIKKENVTVMQTLNYMYLQDMQKHEVIDLFKSILEIARDIFVKNEHHGLDVYLSTKIRHGTISNHLRKPLENESLITLKDKKLKEYNKNTFWENEYFRMSSENMKQMQSFLKNFSSTHDEKIKFISDELLQVSTSIWRTDIEGNILKNGNENAMFQYFFSNMTIMYILNKYILEPMSFEDFTDFIIQILWEITDTNLRNVREYLNNTMKTKILNNFDILQQNIELIDSDTSLLKNAIIRSKSETRKSIDNLITWFARMEDSQRNDYDIKNAIGIIANTFGKIGNKINLKSDDEFKLKGGTLESFVDIFYSLVNNAFQHCGDKTNVPEVVIRIEREADNMLINVSNIVYTDMPVDKLNEQLIPIKNMYGKQQAAERLYKEGGTGFYKIEKIITKDLLIANHELNFGYQKNNDEIEFYVNIELYVKDILI